MRDRYIVAFAIIASFLVVTTLPIAGAATSDKLVVGSQHTTTSDFQDSQALENLTATNGKIKLDHFGRISDSFEDQDLTEYSGDTGVSGVSIQSTTGVTDGSYALELDNNNDNDPFIYSTSGLNAYPNAGEPFSFDVTITETGALPQFRFGLQDTSNYYGIWLDDRSGSEKLALAKTDAGSSTTLATNSSFDPVTGETYHVEGDWGTDGTIGIEVYNEAGSVVATINDTDSTFASGGIGFRQGQFNDGQVFDNIRVGEDPPSSAKYISSIHNVTNAEQAAINITQASNVSIDATARTNGGTVLGSDTYTSASNHTLVLSDTSSEQLEIVLNVDVTGDKPAFQLEDESILFTNHLPEAENASATPQGGTETNNENVTLSIDVSDPEFATTQGDSVQVDFVVDGTVIDTQTISSNQTVSTNATGLSDGSHSWHIDLTDSYGGSSSSDTFSFTVNHYSPDITLEEPANGAKLNQSDVTLGATIEDRDFLEPSGDSVDAEFQTRKPGDSSWTTQDTITVTSNSTVNTTITANTGGTWDWRVVATDEYSLSTTSSQRQFSVPSTLYIRNETNTSQLVGGSVDTTVRFFGNDQIYSRTSSDGKVDISGLPVNEDFIVEVEAGSDYHGRTVYIQSIYEQQTVYLLNQSEESVESRFTLEDPTGQYDSSTVVFIEKPINQSSSVTYRTIHADKFGTEGVTAQLHKGARYRIRIRSASGTTQDIGPYRADVGETVTVRPGSPTIQLGNLTDGWGANATINNRTIEYVYEDPDKLTDSVTVSVHEKGNKSNSLESRTYHDLGSLSGTYSLSENQSDETWVVTFDVDRDGETFTVTEEVSNKPDLVPGLSNAWRLVVGIGLMLISAGVFSLLNASVGGVVVAIEGGILWWTGWLGGATTGAAIVIALFVAVVVHIYSSSGP